MLRGNKFTRQKVPNTYKKNIEDGTLTFRSKWEVEFASFLDNHRHVRKWKMDFPFPYFDQYVSKKNATYYIDFKVHFHDGLIVLFEVKPISSLTEKVKTKSMRYKKIHTHNYLKNISKFDSVVNFCKKSKQKFFLVQKDKKKFQFFTWDAKSHRVFPVNEG